VVWIIPAQAVHFRPLSIEELAGQAELVVRGVVLRRSCQTDEAGRIFTRVELQVHEVWKGRFDRDRLTLVHGGGVLGDRRAVVTGQAEYTVGEEVVVFLVFNQRGEAVTLGLRQGKFHVETPAAGGEPEAANGFAHGPPAGGGSASALAPAAGSARARLPLAELRRRVQQAKTEVRP
jgi:hypothetical protein